MSVRYLGSCCLDGILKPLGRHRHSRDDHFLAKARRAWFATTDEMKAVLGKFLLNYNRNRPYQ